MAKEDSALVNTLYPRIEQSLAKKENGMMLKRAVSTYLDRNNDKLTTAGPVDRPVFSDMDMEQVYHATGLQPADLKDAVKKSHYIQGKWVTMTKPMNVALPLVIRYYLRNKNDEMANVALIYLSLSMYPLLHYRFLKYGANEQIMNYTINNLSNKFKIKQLGTVYAALVETSQKALQLHEKRLITGTDKDIVDFINDVQTRITSFLKNIAREYYINHEKKLYLNLDSDNYEEDNYHEADSNTFAVERLTNKISLNLVVDGPNMRYVQTSANLCSVSVSELRNYVNTMVIGEKREDIRNIIEAILFLFIFDSHNSVEEINSNKFMMYCIETYKKSNTTDENIIKIKKILDSWLEELGTYKKTQRLATINNFRRALFMFFVFTIQTTT